RAADPHGDDGHRAIDADLPSGPLIEPIKGIPGHEHDDDRTFLHAELKAEGGRDEIVVADNPVLIEQDSLAILATKADPRLDDGRKDQNPGSLVGQLARTRNLVDKAM